MGKSKALGTAITLGGVAITGLTSIGEVNPTADELETTTLDSASGYREFLAGLKDGGEVPLTGIYNKQDTGQTALRTNFGTGAAAAVVITFPDSPATTVSFSAWVKGYTMGPADVDGVVGFASVLRITGAVTVA